MIELEETMTFGRFIRPICLDTGDDKRINGEHRDFTIIGFGMLGETREFPDWLQKTTVKEIYSSECGQKFQTLGRHNSHRFPQNIIPSLICTHKEENGNAPDACEGRYD